MPVIQKAAMKTVHVEGGSKRKAEDDTDFGAKKMKSDPTKEVL